MGYLEKMDFVIIDDDTLNNVICSKIIEMTMPGTMVRAFTHPQKGTSKNYLLYEWGLEG